MKQPIELLYPVYATVLSVVIIAIILYALAAVLLAPYLLFFITRQAAWLLGYAVYMIIIYVAYRILI